MAGEEEDEGTARRFLERISYIISRWVSKSAKTETETETGTKFSKFRMHFGELAEQCLPNKTLEHVESCEGRCEKAVLTNGELDPVSVNTGPTSPAIHTRYGATGFHSNSSQAEILTLS